MMAALKRLLDWYRGIEPGPRYTEASVPDTPYVKITDSRTGKSIKVALCNLQGARQAIEAFGGAE